LRRGEILGLIGPNGAGKTTLLNIISGFLTPDDGYIWINKRNIVGLNPTSISLLGLGRTFQIVKPFSNLSVMNNIVVASLSKAPNFYQAKLNSVKITQAMNLTQYENQLPDSLPLVIRKRLEIARALATQPKLLLLDEVMAGLRATEVDDLIRVIRSISSNGIDILIIEHVMRVITALCHKAIVINFGKKIAEGPVQTVLEDPQVINSYLGE
jgi:branched-chain amino acid transport system ATP-binding protein